MGTVQFRRMKAEREGVGWWPGEKGTENGAAGQMVLHAFRRCIRQDAFLRCAENFIFMAASKGVGICALSAIIQLHTSEKWSGGGPSGQQLMPWKGGRLKRSNEQRPKDTLRFNTIHRD